MSVPTTPQVAVALIHTLKTIDFALPTDLSTEDQVRLNSSHWRQIGGQARPTGEESCRKMLAEYCEQKHEREGLRAELTEPNDSLSLGLLINRSVGRM